MDHDLPPGSQNYKIGSGRISKMAAITKNSKNNFFAVWDSKMAAITKNSTEHENDSISITA